MRPTLQVKVVARIHRMIDDGTLLPGSRIPKQQFCEQPGASRTLRRVAYRALASQGLIELHPR